MSLILNHQVLRGFFRIFDSVFPVTVSKVHFTSVLVNGSPSCHFTPFCNCMVKVRPSPLHFQLVASSGTIRSSRFCGESGSNMTRLLNTAANGITVDIVASSHIDALGGLSRWVTRSTPPCF